MFLEVVEEKFPLRHAPKSGHLVIVKADHECSYHIEFLSDIRERTKRLDSLNDAADIEQTRDFPEHWQAIHVKPDTRTTEQLRDVEKVSCAAAQIENPFRTRKIEFKLPNPADVHTDPTLEIEIFGPVRAGICHGVSPANLVETNRINCLDDPLCLQRKTVRAQPPEGMFSRPSQASAIDQFLYFMAKSHSSHLVAKRNNFN